MKYSQNKVDSKRKKKNRVKRSINKMRKNKCGMTKSKKKYREMRKDIKKRKNSETKRQIRLMRWGRMR
jgi:hypothetical protein